MRVLNNLILKPSTQFGIWTILFVLFHCRWLHTDSVGSGTDMHVVTLVPISGGGQGVVIVSSQFIQVREHCTGWVCSRSSCFLSSWVRATLANCTCSPHTHLNLIHVEQHWLPRATPGRRGCNVFWVSSLHYRK